MDISHDGEDDDDVLTALKSSISDKRKQVAGEKKQKQRTQARRAAEQRQHSGQSGQSTLAGVGKERKQPYTKKLGGNPGRHQPTVRTPTLVTKRRTSQPLESEFFFII